MKQQRFVVGFHAFTEPTEQSSVQSGTLDKVDDFDYSLEMLASPTFLFPDLSRSLCVFDGNSRFECVLISVKKINIYMYIFLI